MRIQTFLSCFVLLFLMVEVTVSASEMTPMYDSLYITEEEMQAVTKENESDVIVKLYTYDLFRWIGQEPSKSIQEHIVSSAETFSPRLVSVSPNNLEGEGDLWILLQALLDPLPLFEVLNLADNLEIYASYAFEPKVCYSDAYIYYVTNFGDYIYYNPYFLQNGDNNAYLVPVEIVDEIIVAYNADYYNYHQGINGGLPYEYTYDLSAYCVRGFEEVAVHQHDPSELKNEDEIPRRTEPFFPTAAVIAAAVSLAVLGGVTLAAWLYRKPNYFDQDDS